jgi:hypothetical protein
LGRPHRSVQLFDKVMSLHPARDDRLFRVCCQTVEYFGVLFVSVYWILTFGGSAWGDKFHYGNLFDAGLPVVIIVGVSGLLAWRRYRREAILHFAVVLAWCFWAALPRF